MAGINKVILVGHLGKDPMKKETRDGKPYALFSMATSRRVLGEDRVTWHNVTVWSENSAEYVLKYARSGTLIYVEGELENRQYVVDGITRYAADVVVRQYGGDIMILKDGTPKDGQQRGYAEATGRDPKPKARPKEEPVGYADDLDDEIPF